MLLVERELLNEWTNKYMFMNKNNIVKMSALHKVMARLLQFSTSKEYPQSVLVYVCMCVCVCYGICKLFQNICERAK